MPKAARPKERRIWGDTCTLMASLNGPCSAPVMTAICFARPGMAASAAFSAWSTRFSAAVSNGKEAGTEVGPVPTTTEKSLGMA